MKPVSRSFIESLLKLTRFGNLIIIALTQYFTAGFLIGMHTLNDVNLFFLSLSTVLIAAGGYIINDYYDVKIDYINKPDRVVIGKSITRRYAILFHIALSVAGIVIGFYLSWKIGGVNVLSVFLLWLYSNTLKRLPFVGNLTVAFLTGLAVIIVDLFYGKDNSLVLIYALFAFFMTLVRERNKVKADRKELAKKEKLFKVHVKAQIARKLWNNEGYFPVMNETNEIFIHALKLFDRIPTELNRTDM